MINIEIKDEILDKAVNDAINTLFAAENYHNPLKELVEKAVGTSYSKGELTDAIEEKVISKLNQFMETDKFDELLGKAVANAIAAREVKKDKKL